MTEHFLVDLLTFFIDSSTDLIKDEKFDRLLNDENVHLLTIFFGESRRISFGENEIRLNSSIDDGSLIFIKPNSVKITEKNWKQVR